MSNPIIKGCIERKDFSKLPAKIEIPELLEIQKKSFEKFLQKDLAHEHREEMGLQAAFDSVFPISDFNGTAILRFTEYSLGEPKYEIWECIERGMTFAAPLKIRVNLEILEKDEKTGAKSTKEVREQWVYLGELPLMTENGTFIINGTERVVVSQLQRSPGTFFTHDKGRTHISGKVLFSARIIPYRGSWLDFEFDTKDTLHARIDRRRKFPVTILLKAIGYSTHDILKLYYPIEDVMIRNNKFYSKVDPKVINGSRIPYDITNEKTGEIVVKKSSRITHGILKKLDNQGIKEVPVAADDMVDRIIFDDVVDPATGEVIVGSNTILTEALVDRIAQSGIEKINLLYIDNFQNFTIIRDTLSHENIDSQESAIIEIYKRLRPGESPTPETAKIIFDNLFFNARRYDLAPVGRLKLNKKLGIDVPLSQRTLTPQDIVETIRYLVNLKSNKGEIDDIDHLGNRRVRCVGELLENQFRIGLSRMERSIKERMNILDLESALPHDLINAKSVIAAVKEFFGSSQLSQFMDQTNPLSEITHKRRLSALGPGGLTRERAGFEVRDVHPTHYGRICPIETPEGPNIGLITSLSTYARVNEYGFIESPYRKVTGGKVSDDIIYLSAIDGDKYYIAQANTPVNATGKIVSETVSARYGGDFVTIPSDKVEFMDVSPKQIVSVATSLIPFLENDDANRALMGSNMQRQAVPLIHTDAPLVGTGMEKIVARDSGRVVLAKRPGIVEYVDANRIVVRAEEAKPDEKSKKERPVSEGISLDIYNLTKFKRSNQNTCINQKPIVSAGQKVEKGEVLADGPATSLGELALGQNILVAFMPWEGYNFEDAIIISERLVKDDRYTSIHIEEFEIESRDTKLGREEITRDIPNVSEELLRNLDESGIVRIGAEVVPGDILVAKVAPKGETQLTPEEKLLRAIFGEKAGDVKDVSLTVPPGIEGTVVDVRIFSRKGVEKDERSKSIENDEVSKLQKEQQEEIRIIEDERNRRLRRFLTGKTVGKAVTNPENKKVILPKSKELSENILKEIKDENLTDIVLDNQDDMDRFEEMCSYAQQQTELLQAFYEDKIGRVRKGDELPPGVIKLVKVYIAIKRKLAVGDKMAGRHGNKGVVSVIMPEEDMPYLADGTPVEMILNPLGVPSRMNVGQILETHLGWAAKALGIHVTTPVFDGASENEIVSLLKEGGRSVTGQATLYDGRKGEPFDREVTVGYMYMMKLHHLVADKIHARSIGPYSLVTQQPLGGKAQFGGQRLGEMEVWALQAYGAAATLQEFLTVKSDDVPGRSKMYEAIVKGENFLTPGLPESFNVLIKELQSLGLDVELLKSKDGK